MSCSALLKIQSGLANNRSADIVGIMVYPVTDTIENQWNMALR